MESVWALRTHGVGFAVVAATAVATARCGTLRIEGGNLHQPVLDLLGEVGVDEASVAAGTGDGLDGGVAGGHALQAQTLHVLGDALFLYFKEISLIIMEWNSS